MHDPTFGHELMKLLARLAAVDGHIAPEEIEMILSVGRNHGVDDLLVETVREQLQDGETLGAPNVAILKAHEGEVRRQAFALVAADGHFEADEMKALDLLDQVLAGAR